MARNACAKCGNAIGSEDCIEACSAIEDVRQAFAQKSLVQAAYPREMHPFIDAAKKELEAKYKKHFDMTQPKTVPSKIYAAIMAKATKDWLSSRS